ncbi:MAG TPA: TonB family protein [Candidatus Sulfotelmatobacter sp.]|nr:TonB family protein [Candidatus Sulfotelmatobacter sp.]
MVLRCFVFSSDEGTCDIIRQALTGLGVEGEACSTPSIAVQRVASESFQLVVVDWDQQPEATMVLSAARERKPSERPLSLAIVSDDSKVPQALQSGANSILRKPLVATQVTDTLSTACQLLRSRMGLAVKPAQAAAAGAGSSAGLPASMEAGREKTLRAGEFLQSAPLNPSAQFVTESENTASADQSVVQPIDPLKDLETVAAAPPPPLPADDGPKGLEWYLKKKGISRPAPGAATAPAPPPTQTDTPELLGYDQTPSSPSQPSQPDFAEQSPAPVAEISPRPPRNEVPSFGYAAKEPEEPHEVSASRFRPGKRAIVFASTLAAFAILAAPQAPWHPQMKALFARGQRSLHTWLHPQPVTSVTVAPAAHEDFGRAGDEYKLPVAETIPDATTDPSQIQVLPAVDPTAKKPADDTTPDQLQTVPDGTTGPGGDANQPAVQVQRSATAAQPSQAATPVTTPAVAQPTTAAATPAPSSTPVQLAPQHTDQPSPAPTQVVPAPTPVKRPPVQYIPTTSAKVPSSLQSQMAVMVPDASGNKPLEAAMQAIEPVSVPELSERTLLTAQPAIAYPSTAKGQQGTVILQVLIGRDGTVQDAKFLQGSFAFARAAIDGVKQWKFKPYIMNARPVSVQTNLTIKFKPGQ